MASSLKFVDSIASSPTTRLDVNDRTTWRLHVEGTEFPPPPLDQAVASTLMQDGAVIPASAYGLRTIRLMLSVDASTADATATQLQTLYRELNRPGNILRWEHETTNPVFFRTFRTSADSIVDLGKIDGKRKLLQMAILAEPFAYGLLETPVSGVTVNADPAAGSNGCFVDVTGVKGDVEAPALIRWPHSALAQFRETVFASRRRGTPSATPFPFQVEAMTQTTDTTTQANDTAFSGAGNNYSRTTFATNATMVTRAFTFDIGTASVDLRGRYRVFLRYRKNTAGDDINIRLVWGDSGGSVTNDTFATPDVTSITTADLGLISIPQGVDPVYDFRSGTELVVDDGFGLLVQAERTSGSGTLDMDYLVLVPADDRLGLVKWGFPGSIADRWWLDAYDWSVHARTASDEVVSVQAPLARSGGLPMLSPGVTNRIFALYEVGTGRAHAIATTTVVSVSYYPLYLSVRPAST